MLAKIKRRWNDLKFARAFFRFVENPERTEELFALGDPEFAKFNAGEPTPLRENAAYLKTQAGFQKLWEERYLPKLPPPQTLLKLAPGTFGHTYAQHMIKAGLAPDFFPLLKPQTELEYFGLRMRQVHDLWHVLTGYGTSHEEELTLQGFTLGQIKTGFPALVLSASLLHILHDRPGDMSKALDMFEAGRQRGSKAAFLIGVKIEDRLGENLYGLREELGLL